MVNFTPVSLESARILNRQTGRGMWLYTSGEGTLQVAEVNPDAGHCPSLLVDPVSSPYSARLHHGRRNDRDPPIRWNARRRLYGRRDGLRYCLAISLAGSTMVFQYSASASDVLKFTVKSSDGTKTARRLFTPATITLGPAYLTDSLSRTLYTDGWPASATLSFDRDVVSVSGSPSSRMSGLKLGR